MLSSDSRSISYLIDFIILVNRTVLDDRKSQLAAFPESKSWSRCLAKTGKYYPNRTFISALPRDSYTGFEIYPLAIISYTDDSGDTLTYPGVIMKPIINIEPFKDLEISELLQHGKYRRTNVQNISLSSATDSNQSADMIVSTDFYLFPLSDFLLSDLSKMIY